MLQAGMCVLKTEAKRSLNSFVFSMSFVTSFSAPLSLGLHLQEALFPYIPINLQLCFSISLYAPAMFLYSSWVTYFCFHFSTSFSCWSSARCSLIHTSLLPGLLDFLHVGRSLWRSPTEINLSWAVAINSPHFHQWGYHITDSIVLSKQQLPKNCWIPDCHTAAANIPTVIAISGLNLPLQTYPARQTPKGSLKKYFGTLLFVLLRFIVYQCVIWWLPFQIQMILHCIVL